MDLALNNIQKLICHKTQPTNQTNKQANKQPFNGVQNDKKYWISD